MNNKTKLLISSFACAAVLCTTTSSFAAEKEDANGKGIILFKIHDVSPDKDVNGLVTGCNISVTLYNRYDRALSNTQLQLIWDDEVVDEAISQEEMAQKEALRRNPENRTMRYPTSSNTPPTISTVIKMPLINAHQQLSLKNKINTDRCFLLLNDMNIKVNSCSFTGEGNNKGCSAHFQYISPRDPQYYTEFKEISYDAAVSEEENKINQTENNNKDIYDNIVNTLNKIGQ